MKLVAAMSLKIKNGLLPQFISALYKYGVGINQINLTQTDNRWDDYSIEITYTHKKELIRLLDSLNRSTENFRNITITSTLEDRIKGGLLRTFGKIELENINDIETSLLGGNRLIHEKIDAGLGKSYCGCFNSIGLFSGYRASRNSNISRLYGYYADSERDAVIISRFTGRNAFPCVIRYSSIEDFIKSIKAVEENFACIRLYKMDEEDLSFSTIADSLTRPLISFELDEEPLFYLSLIKKICSDHKIKPAETAVGIIGLSSSAIRLTALLNKTGFAKVLGYDGRERIMMSFETRRGLATTVENIVSNCDIIILNDEQGEFSLEDKMQAGQIYISRTVTEKLSSDLKKLKGLKDFIVTDENSTMALMSGLVNGIMMQEEKTYTDEMLLKLSDMVFRSMTEKYALPGIFGDFQEKMEQQIQRIKPAS